MSRSKGTTARAWLYGLRLYEAELRPKYARHRRELIRRAADDYAGGTDLPSYLFTAYQRTLAGLLAAHYTRVVPFFADQAVRQLTARRPHERKAAESAFLAHALEWVGREALRKAKYIADTDRDEVMGAIASGLEDGLGVEETARLVRKRSALTLTRAALVARTETHAAASYASVEAVRTAEQELGVRMLKEWLPVSDGRTRDAHAAMANHSPIPLGEKFVVGGELMDRPGDPSASPENVINCRCAIAYAEAAD